MHSSLIRLDRRERRFRPAAGAARHRSGDSARPDAGHDRRERLRQDGVVEDDHRAVAARRAARSISTAATWPTLGEKELTRQRIRFGFLFQQAALFDSMTIAQNVAFPLRQHTRKSAGGDSPHRLGPAGRGGLAGGHLGKKPAELSGGMRKRVGLARRLALEPEIMLYDEPTTGLDPIMSDVINELILGTRRQHPVTSIVVTHDMRTAQKVADRVVMLYPLARLAADEPQVLYDGPPDRIEQAADSRVSQFVHGEAGERLMEMRQQNGR